MLNAAQKRKSPTEAGLTKLQKPLNLRTSPPNDPSVPVPKKRRMQRSMSSNTNLGALHGAQQFHDENSWEANSTIDLTAEDDRVSYPSLPHAGSTVVYPSIPSQTVISPQPPASSLPVPWSSSPAWHHQSRIQNNVAEDSDPPVAANRPGKRRKIPWKTEEKKDEMKAPLPLVKTYHSPNAWEQSASELKAQQKQVRKSKQTEEPDITLAKAKDVAKFFLSKEQRDILEAVVNGGKSIFFTGSAGTGKSVLMKAIISELRHRYYKEPDRVAVTASTGLAGCNIDGMTLHSFAGAGLAKEPAPDLVKKIRKNQKAVKRWIRTKVLIIDEISMVDGHLFDKLEQVARTLRKSGVPFGGIQLVITGDFFQLPPVPEKGGVAQFAFEASSWNTAIAHTILLSHVFRQKDPKFAGMLNEMRLGRLTPATIQAFKALSRPLDFHDNLEATNLFPMRHEVEYANNRKMNALSGETFTFDAEDGGMLDATARERVLSNLMAPKQIRLKKGAQVMLIKNLNNSLVNGSLGKVVCFTDDKMFSYRTDHEDEYDAAYGGTELDPEKAQKIRNKIHSAVYKNSTVRGRIFPVVAFQVADGTTQQMCVQPEEWRTELPNGETQAKRVQLPLILAWAISIHKAQGQTLERVTVDLGRAFEKGQAYVALSRATTQEGLRVLNFDARKVMVHHKVSAFYEKLISIDSLKKKQEREESGIVDDEEAEVQEVGKEVESGDEYGLNDEDPEDLEKLIRQYG